MERCLEVFVARTHKTRISGQQALNDPRVAVRNGLEDRGCVIHGGSRQNSLIIDRHGAAPLISLHDPPAKGVPDQHWRSLLAPDDRLIGSTISGQWGRDHVIAEFRSARAPYWRLPPGKIF
jgi:hypothetical protein